MTNKVNMPIDLKNTRILISNDDGVEAEGIALLERIARTLSDDVWVVAPDKERSGAGHSLSLHAPLRYRQVAERRYWVDGTPTDAVLVGVMEILKDKRPGLMLSGINRGSNLAEDVTYSGTVSAAMEATLLEIPSIALSNTITEAGVDWSTPEKYTADIIRSLTKCHWPTGTLMNVNFPALPPEQIKGIKPCPQGRRKLDDNLHRRVDPHGRNYIWIGGQRTEPFSEHPTADYMQIKQGYITITPLNLDMTQYPMLEELRGVLEPQA
jgi:5'-nucleotidase